MPVQNASEMISPLDADRIRLALSSIRSHVKAAAGRVGRSPESIRLIVVTKSVGSAAVDALGGCGVTDVAENRVLEGIQKKRMVKSSYRWHFIGHLQTNKVKKAMEEFDVIHSIDRRGLAETCEAVLTRMDRTLEAFVQVNVSGERTKQGLAPAEAKAFLSSAVQDFPHLRWVGLMTMAPVEATSEETRSIFRDLRMLGESCAVPRLSMGMSHDFEIAVEEGATDVRIGTAIFGG